MSKIDDLERTLRRYEGFDGALVLGVGFTFGVPDEAWMELKAYRIPEGDVAAGWKIVKIVATGRVFFSWSQSPFISNVVPNWPASIHEIDGSIVIDLDPLHQEHRPGGFELSDCAIGGEFLQIDELGDLHAPIADSVKRTNLPVRDFRASIVLSISRALWGEVVPALRAVLARPDGERGFKIEFYVDGDAVAEYAESASCVEGEVMGDFLPEVEISQEVIRLDAPARVPHGNDTILIYLRKEALE